MAEEFIIGFTEHRAVGNIFVPLMIEKEKLYYTVNRVVKLRDVKSGVITLADHELELLKLIENYSDEMLVKKFSKKADPTSFFQNLDKELFENHISPYIEKYIYRVILLLMKGNTRLFFKQAKYGNLYDEDEIKVNASFSDCTFYFNRNSSGTKYHLKITHEGKTVNLLNRNTKMVCTQPCSFVYMNRLYVFRQLSGKKLIPFLTKPELSIPLQAEEKYYQSFILNTIRDFEVEATGFLIVESQPPRTAILSLEQDLSLNPVIVVKFKYGNSLYLADTVSTVFVNLEKAGGNYIFHKFVRDRNWEDAQLTALKSMGLKYKNGFWNPTTIRQATDADLYYRAIEWLSENSKKLNELGFKTQQLKLAKKYFTGSQTLDIQINNNEDWFDIYAIVKFGDHQIPFIRLRKYILKNIREYELPSGEIAILPLEWFTSYRDIFPFIKLEGNLMKVKKHHFQLLQDKFTGIDQPFFKKLNKLSAITGEQAEVPQGLKAQMRNYQKEGYSWMVQLHENQLGGCLADDMGLGKTLQTIALLLKVKKLENTVAMKASGDNQLSLFAQNETQIKTQPASLIVMPTSLIHNWDNEIQKFAPALKVYKHVGATRLRSEKFSQTIELYDIILTTYGTLRNDYEMLGQYEFFYLILDESQNIKNASSKTYKSLLEIHSKHKLVITGTPIENSLSDLWSQMNFLNRGLLGSLPYFKREFIGPIEKKEDEQQQAKLQKLIRPFVLRRTKEEVASDLPALTEQIRYCEMTDEQKEIYETEKSAIRNAILENIETNGLKKSALVVLQGLTKLRQLANHPSMVIRDTTAESGKFDEIYRCLKNLVAEKHKVLVFSSFVKHLQLLQDKIESKNWKYSLLTGKTTDRKEVINQFQDDPENHIFLISLKAGGVGLNLTSADYVFIIDPWWNPAAEIQAINRAHRIGQDKKVFVYRFITEDSIEEKIQTLKSKKSALAEKFISSNNPISAISEEDILNLFS